MNSNLYQERYDKLNPSQKEAVDSIEGPVLVVAGPGSGKTEILSLRICNILKQTDIPASSILCLTFTNSACKNMRQRLRSLIGKEADEVAIHTFHSFCSYIISSHPEYFFLGQNYQPLDEINRLNLVTQIFENLAWNNPLNSFHPEHGYSYLNSVIQCITALKQAGISPENFKKILHDQKTFLIEVNSILSPVFNLKITKKTIPLFQEACQEIFKLEYKNNFENFGFLAINQHYFNLLNNCLQETIAGETTKFITKFKDTFLKKDEDGIILKDILNIPKNEALAEIYEQYQNKLDLLSYYDFDDMLLEVLEKFSIHSKLVLNYQEQFLYLMVDEFQDTNGAQMQLLNFLLKNDIGDPNILAVGDDDQAIYKFQGARLENILNFQNNYTQTKIINLIYNYRSKQEILNLASKVIAYSSMRIESFTGIKKELISKA